MKKKLNVRYVYIFASVIVIFSSIFYLNSRTKPLDINNCSAEINERIVNQNTRAHYYRVISITGGMGFVKDTGIVYSDGTVWHLSRNYTFSVKEIRKGSYSYEKISMYASSADNVPDAVIRKVMPDSLSGIKLIHIEEVQPKTWMFSGLRFTLFTCKQK